MRKMKVGELVEDITLYPRGSIDSHHVGEMRQAHRAGVEFPPIVIDRKTHKIADGIHRRKVYLLEEGPDFEIEVVEKSYKSDAELFLDAIRYNAAHGLRLDKADKVHCILVAESLKIAPEQVAAALALTPDAVGELRANRVGQLRSAAGSLPEPVALKRTIQHMAGRTLTKIQAEANKRSSGMAQQFYVNQVIDLIEAKLLDTDDSALMDRLKVLHGLLEGMFAAAV